MAGVSGCGHSIEPGYDKASVPQTNDVSSAPTLSSTSAVSSTPEGASASATESPPEFVSLFDGKSLTGWSINRGEGEGLPAEQIFTVDDVGIHVYAAAEQGSAQPIASLTSEREYSRFVLELQYKWGTNRFGERSETERDAGVLYHVHTDVTRVWPPSLEMQLGTSALDGRWVTGDVFILGGITQAVVNGQVANEGRFRTTVLAEKPQGEWNQLRLEVDADKQAIYELNGIVLNQLQTFKKKVGEEYVTLDRGKVALQAEYAELWYRNVRIAEL